MFDVLDVTWKGVFRDEIGSERIVTRVFTASSREAVWETIQGIVDAHKLKWGLTLMRETLTIERSER